MKPENLKAHLQRDKEFLRSLYESSSVFNSRRILNFSSDSKLNSLIHFLHFVSSGQVKMKKENFDAFGKRHLNIFKKYLDSKKSLQNFLNFDRLEKLKVLNKLCAIFPHILHILFNDD